MRVGKNEKRGQMGLDGVQCLKRQLTRNSGLLIVDKCKYKVGLTLILLDSSQILERERWGSER